MPNYQANCADVRVASVGPGANANESVVEVMFPDLPKRKFNFPVTEEYLRSVMLVMGVLTIVHALGVIQDCPFGPLVLAVDECGLFSAPNGVFFKMPYSKRFF